MKKLMIAAALVAMIGTAEAASYTFKATLKTTCEKQGKQGKTATQNFGYDANGNMYWHEDAAFTAGGQFENLVKWTTKKRGKITYQIQTIKQSDVNKLDVDTQDQLALILSTYDSKDPNGDWCLSLYFATPAICYRAPTTKKYEGTLYEGINGCCYDGQGDYPQKGGFDDLDVGQITCTTDKTDIGVYSSNGFEWVFGYRINGQESKSSKTIEMVAKMDWNNEITNWDYGTIANDFALAGQGKFDVNKGNITSISGKIVGTLAAPVCGCCDKEKEARVFTCSGYFAYDYIKQGNPGYLTAAFGDFTITRK